ncbi:hypothetical protein E4U21_001135 [Claviceps maximensis]|nr:hypothetical protein E4U21_001135 [Claviceps maximensis]
MTRKSSRWVCALSGGLLLGRQASGFYLTLSNFQSVSTLSLPLECIFAYNTPMQGCVVGDFGKSAICSSACLQGVVRIQSSIQESCAMVRTGARSLLDEAQNGHLVAAICRTRQAPPESPQSTWTGTSSSTAREDESTAISVTTTGPRSTPYTSGQPPSATLTSTQGAHGSITTPSAPSRSSTSSSSSSAAVQTRPRGGGGSPFDAVPESSARRSGSSAARLSAVGGSCVLGLYLWLY